MVRRAAEVNRRGAGIDGVGVRLHGTITAN
jgi:hypothetical protein